MKKISFVMLVIGFLMASLTGCASMSAEEAGQGVFLGGVGSGSSGIAGVGIIISEVGRVWSKPPVGSPEFEKRKAKIYKSAAHNYFVQDFSKAFVGKPETTIEQVSSAAREYCAAVDKKVAGKEVVPLSRKSMEASFIGDEFLPEGDGEIIGYALESDPFDGGCVWILEGSGEWVVQHAKQASKK